MGQELTKHDWRRRALMAETRAHLTSRALADLVDQVDRAADSKAPARAMRAIRISQVMERARRPLDINERG